MHLYWWFEGSASESRLPCEQCDAIDTHSFGRTMCARFASFCLCRAHCLPDRLRSTECVICLISNYIVSKCQRYPSPMPMTYEWNLPQNSLACITVAIVSMRLSAILIDTSSACVLMSKLTMRQRLRGIETVSAYRHRNRWHIFGFAQSVPKIKGTFSRQMRCRIAIHSSGNSYRLVYTFQTIMSRSVASKSCVRKRPKQDSREM